MKNIFFLMTVIAMAGCGEAEQGKPVPEAKAETKEVEFFPVTSFIEGQVHIVDSFQSLTMRYRTIGNKKDTALISVDEFRQLAREFTRPDFNDPKQKQYYKENSFADQSIKAVTFNYSTDRPDLEIQRVDVVVDASAVMNDKVRSIYMEKQSRHQDTFVYKKLYWRSDRNFQVITTREIDKKPGIVSVVKVEWN